MMNRRQFTRPFMSFSALLLITFIILPAVFSSASPTEVIRFGPKQYTRSAGKPETITDSFSAVPGAGTIIIENGAGDPGSRVRSAVVSLNGAEVFGPSAFNPHVAHLEKAVSLVTDNTLSIELRGKPNTFFTLRVIQEAEPPTVTLTTDPATIMQGGSATLSWTSANADSALIDQGIGTVQPAGSLTITPSETTVYTITVQGPGGTAQATASVTVLNPPTCQISADPSSIKKGESATLSWTSANAEGASIDQGIGAVPVSGSHTITPSATTVYTITVQGPGGTAFATAQVQVTNPQPTVSISANPETILFGGSSTLSWTSTDAETASLDQGIGSVPVSGSLTVTPQHPIIYTITVTGPGGTASATAGVIVKADVKPQPEGAFGEQYQDLIPPDSTAGQYDPKRFSVITGLVHDQAGAPIPDVAVAILLHPEYGTALSDAEGRYSLPVEGGSVMTVACRQEGLITAHRKVNVPWNDIAIVETMVMIPYDQKATTVTFDGNPNTVVAHQSTAVTDEWGTRSCTTVFTGDNKAFLVDEDGNPLEELTTITTRATEFTTPDAMPARLPPNSAYTYCVDLTVDGAERVKFQKPIITWVDNFLGFPVGMAVPVGSYDRDRGVWVPELNGRVVKLLDTNSDGIVDALDATGDNQPDDLNKDGSFSDEVQGLSDTQSYQPGAIFWRFAATHFTPHDPNYPAGTPQDATGPNPTGEASTDSDAVKTKDKECKKDRKNSLVRHISRTFHEDIPIPGTGFTLHYASDRVDGYHQIITVPVSGATVPASLKRIIVRVNVAGRFYEQILNPLPNQQVEIAWDGLDHLGKPVKGSTILYVNIGFVYNAVYYIPANLERSFGQAGIGPTPVQTREEITLWKRDSFKLPKGVGTIAEGWTISLHHFLSLVDPSTLHKGDGAIIEAYSDIITTVAGTGAGGVWGGFAGDGGPATEAKLSIPQDVAFDTVGNLYIADAGNHRIRKVDTQGIITTIAGSGPTGINGGGFSGDGGPATQARFNFPIDIAIDAAGNLYISDGYNHRIRKVNTNGIITTFAGTGSQGNSGDGGPATQARLNYPGGIALDAQGNLYIADSANGRIRKVDTNGIITTIAGTEPWSHGGDGGPAIQAGFDCPEDVTVDASGNIYVSDTWAYRVRKIDTSGIITTVAGTGEPGYSGDGGPATQAQLDELYGVVLDAQGNLYIADWMNDRIRKVYTNGIITTVVGSGESDHAGDGGPAIQADILGPMGFAINGSGTLHFTEHPGHTVRKIEPPSVFEDFLTSDDISFADENGLGYIMASSGRHKKTVDLDTGKVLYEFGYNDDKNLVSITDRFSNQTVITRDGNGTPRSITSPDGITTTLTMDGDNHLTGITYPDGSSYGFEYTPTGLMTVKREPEGNRFAQTYNTTGRITDATDEEGGHSQYSRTAYANGDILTEFLTAEGDRKSYLDHYYSTGAYTSTTTDPTGAQTLYARSADELSVNKTLPCGMEYAFSYGIDSEYGFQYVKGMWEDTPAGLERITQHQKTYQDTNSDKVPDRITEQITVNAKATTLVTNTLAATRVLTTPLGRIVTATYDPTTLLTSKLTIPGLFDTAYGYDTKGRLTLIRTDAREMALSYNAQGFLETITDPEDQTTTYTYDAVGRMTNIQRPDSSSISFVYDKNGNMIVLTTPSAIDHGFGYNKVNLNDVYEAPLSGQYQYHYDRDRRLTQIAFPSGIEINNIYNNGRLTQIQTPEGDIDFTYLCGAKVGSVAMGAEGIAYGYDGSLVTSEALSGTINQTLGYAYNKDFDLTGFTYAGGTTAYTYDNDGLLTKAGAYTITRNAQNGLPTGVTGGALSLTRGFNGYGEVSSESFSVNSQDLTSWNLGRDDNGRIVSKQISVNGITANYTYTYDPMGRLLTVTKDGALVEEYQYNQNGTRISEVNALREISGRTFTYSDEDHLLTAGNNTTYQYDADGFLVTKTKGTEVTEYAYSSRGELLQVQLPDGKMIEYLHDPYGRRIAKVVNGTITEKYLWQGLTQLLAIYDGSNNLLMRFEYTDARMPVSMTKSGSTYYLTYDQIGTLKVISDASGNVIKRIDYDSFGNILSDSNSTFVVPFGFAGGLCDRDTSLVRFGFRDYDSDIGRWTAKDPIGFRAWDMDLYGYCMNDPVNLLDPAGLGGVTKSFVKKPPKPAPERIIGGGIIIAAGLFKVGVGSYIVYLGFAEAGTIVGILPAIHSFGLGTLLIEVGVFEIYIAIKYIIRGDEDILIKIEDPCL